jgi:DNA invertase Pin-like site-specific DNA recombinase
MATGNFVAYYRVSTQKQGQSGLGLEDQRGKVCAYLDGGDWRLIGEHTEIETGKMRDRPALAQALAQCRLTGATLIVAKVDRLSRDTEFLLSIERGTGEAGVLFCDLPKLPPGPVGKFMLTQMAAVAELEAGLISERTKAALAVAKARGRVLGGWRATKRDGSPRKPPGPITGAQAAAKARTDAHAARVLPIVKGLRSEGASLNAIVRELTERHVATLNGGRWTAATVSRLLKRASVAIAGEGMVTVDE